MKQSNLESKKFQHRSMFFSHAKEKNDKMVIVVLSKILNFILRVLPLFIFFNVLYVLAYGFVTYKAWSDNDFSNTINFLIGLIGISIALGGICISFSKAFKKEQPIYLKSAERYLYSSLSAIIGFGLSYVAFQINNFEKPTLIQSIKMFLKLFSAFLFFTITFTYSIL